MLVRSISSWSFVLVGSRIFRVGGSFIADQRCRRRNRLELCCRHRSRPLGGNRVPQRHRASARRPASGLDMRVAPSPARRGCAIIQFKRAGTANLSSARLHRYLVAFLVSDLGKLKRWPAQSRGTLNKSGPLRAKSDESAFQHVTTAISAAHPADVTLPDRLAISLDILLVAFVGGYAADFLAAPSTSDPSMSSPRNSNHLASHRSFESSSQPATALFPPSRQCRYFDSASDDYRRCRRLTARCDLDAIFRWPKDSPPFDPLRVDWRGYCHYTMFSGKAMKS